MEQLSFRSMYEEGQGYLRAAAGKKKKFSPSISYNLLSMALEKFIMSGLDFTGNMPDNHTFTDLVEATDRHCPLPQEVRAELLELEKYQQICSFSDYFRTDDIDENTIVRMRKVVFSIEKWAETICFSHASA